MPYAAIPLPAPVDNGSGTGVITLTEALPAGTIIVVWGFGVGAGPGDSGGNIYHVLVRKGMVLGNEQLEWDRQYQVRWARVADPIYGGDALGVGDTIQIFQILNFRAMAFSGVPVDATPTLLPTSAAAGYPADTPTLTSAATQGPPVLIVGLAMGCNTDYPNVYDDGWDNYSPNPYPAVPAFPAVSAGGFTEAANLTDTGVPFDQVNGAFYQPMAARLVGFYERKAGTGPYTVSPTITGLGTGFGTNTGVDDWSALHEGHWLIHWWGFETVSDAIPGAWVLITRAGQGHIAYSDETGIRYQRSDHPTGTLGAEIAVTDLAGDVEPRMVEVLHERGRIRLVFAYEGADTYQTWSDDNGATWSDPVSLIAGGIHPDILYDPASQMILYAAYVSGELKGRLQGPGSATPGTTFTFVDSASVPLPVDDAYFHIAPSATNTNVWVLVLIDGGEMKRYQSTDKAKTWAEIV